MQYQVADQGKEANFFLGRNQPGEVVVLITSGDVPYPVEFKKSRLAFAKSQSLVKLNA